jgi:hypothetical protein
VWIGIGHLTKERLAGWPMSCIPAFGILDAGGGLEMTQWLAPTKSQAMVQRLHGLVTYGPVDLDIAAAMAAYGYDEVKWAEGQALLAELLACDSLPEQNLVAVDAWYAAAAYAAQQALVARPRLLAKLGLG